jgi:exopolysaccharide production protein ExoZ
MTYRNIQGLRAIAALLVVSCHMFWSIPPMRQHWAKPFFTAVGPMGVDIFFVISGFIIYHAMRRSIVAMTAVSRGRAVYRFAMKRFLRIYPLYWIVFAAACAVMAWAPPTAVAPVKPLWQLLTLIDSLPNFRVNVAWTLTFEVYFYAIAAVSLWLLAHRAMVGLGVWFVAIALATLHGLSAPLTDPFAYLFAPILLEFAMGIVVAILVERGIRTFHPSMLLVAITWLAAGAWLLVPNPGSFAWHLVCWGMPAALLVYSLVAMELRGRWIMPRVLQYAGDASYSIYLWHLIVFGAVAGLYERLGWLGVVKPTILTALMVAIGLGAGLLSYHCLEKPLLRRLGHRPEAAGTASPPSGPGVRAGNLAT